MGSLDCANALFQGRVSRFCKHPLFSFRSYCVGRPVIAFIPAVVGSNAISVILALLIADVTAVSCFPAAVCIPLVLDVLTVSGSVADP
jgi:hypothetical protein